MLPESLVFSVDVNPELFIENRSQIVQFCVVRAHSLHVAQSVASTLVSEKRRDIGIVPRWVAVLYEGTIAAKKILKYCLRWDSLSSLVGP